MHYSTCSCSTLPLPRPEIKNHSDIFLPLPESSYARSLRVGLTTLLTGFNEGSINDITLYAIETAGFWSLDAKIYYAAGGYSGEYDPETLKWKPKHWNNMPNALYGKYIWSDGIDVYYNPSGSSSSSISYRLNQATETWESIDMIKPNHFFSERIWTDGTDTYYSDECNQKIWNRAKLEWVDITWNGDMPQYFQGYDTWKDTNGNIYLSGYASATRQPENGSSGLTDGVAGTWKFNKASRTWTSEPQYDASGNEIKLAREAIWYDGNHFRYNLRYRSTLYCSLCLERMDDGKWHEVSEIAGVSALYPPEDSSKWFSATGFWSDGINVFYTNAGSDPGGGYGILLPDNACIYSYSGNRWHPVGFFTGVIDEEPVSMLMAPRLSSTDYGTQLSITNPSENEGKVSSYDIYKESGEKVKTVSYVSNPQIVDGLNNEYYYQATANGTDGSVSEKSEPVQPSCFVAGTPVHMADGSYKMIEDVKVGDKVKSFDINTSNFCEAEVTDIAIQETTRIAMVLFEDSTYLAMAEGHPLYTDDGWHSITNKDGYPTLKVGDKVLSPFGYIAIIDLQVVDSDPTPVYSLTISGDIYFTGTGAAAITHGGGSH